MSGVAPKAERPWSRRVEAKGLRDGLSSDVESECLSSKIGLPRKAGTSKISQNFVQGDTPRRVLVLRVCGPVGRSLKLDH